MSRPLWSVRHVTSRDLLPETLVRGRAYFVDDEQVIIIDHGLGPVVYGGRPGPQGLAGEPIPQLQEQIDSLAESSLTHSRIIHRLEMLRHISEDSFNAALDALDQFTRREISKARKDFEEIIGYTDTALRALITSTHEVIDSEIQTQRDEIDTEIQTQREELDASIDETRASSDEKLLNTSEGLQRVIADLSERITENIDSVSEAVLKLTAFVYAQNRQYNNAINTLTHLVTELYPYHNDGKGDSDSESESSNLKVDDLLATDYGSYRVTRLVKNQDGSVTVNLDVIELYTQTRIEALETGDQFTDSSGYIWTVTNTQSQDGEDSICITCSGTPELIQTLKAGDVILFTGGSFTVDDVTHEGSQGVIRLTLNE